MFIESRRVRYVPARFVLHRATYVCFAELEDVGLSQGDDSYDTSYPVERNLVEFACMGTRRNLLHKRYRIRCPGWYFDVDALAHMGTRFF